MAQNGEEARILSFRSRIGSSSKGLTLCCNFVILSLIKKDRQEKAALYGRRKFKKWWWEMDRPGMSNLVQNLL